MCMMLMMYKDKYAQDVYVLCKPISQRPNSDGQREFRKKKLCACVYEGVGAFI